MNHRAENDAGIRQAAEPCWFPMDRAGYAFEWGERPMAEHIVPPVQSKAFHLAVCERLGIDPAIVSADDFAVEFGEGRVTLTAFLPADELVAMFNNAAGRSTDG